MLNYRAYFIIRATIIELKRSRKWKYVRTFLFDVRAKKREIRVRKLAVCLKKIPFSIGAELMCLTREHRAHESGRASLSVDLHRAAISRLILRCSLSDTRYGSSLARSIVDRLKS